MAFMLEGEVGSLKRRVGSAVFCEVFSILPQQSHSEHQGSPKQNGLEHIASRLEAVALATVPGQQNG